MIISLTTLLTTLSSIFRSRAALELENLALATKSARFRGPQENARNGPQQTACCGSFCPVSGATGARRWLIKPETVAVWHRAGLSPVLDLEDAARPGRSSAHLSAPFYLDLKPEEVMMCAAHVPNLQTARSYGLRTGFIYRPNEYGGGPAGVPDKAKPDDFDVVSVSIIDLAQQMGT
jgi:hypothetical protein